jgi:hypothetical protein
VSNINASMGSTTSACGQASEPLTMLTAGNAAATAIAIATRVKSTGVNASADYQRFFNAEHTRSLVLSYQSVRAQPHPRLSLLQSCGYDAALHAQRQLFGCPHSATDHNVKVDYTTPMGQGQTLNVGAKYINHLNK